MNWAKTMVGSSRGSLAVTTEVSLHVLRRGLRLVSGDGRCDGAA